MTLNIKFSGIISSFSPNSVDILISLSCGFCPEYCRSYELRVKLKSSTGIRITEQETVETKDSLFYFSDRQN